MAAPGNGRQIFQRHVTTVKTAAQHSFDESHVGRLGKALEGSWGGRKGEGGEGRKGGLIGHTQTSFLHTSARKKFVGL